MNEEVVSGKRKSCFVWTMRILYIIIVLILAVNIFSLIQHIFYISEYDYLLFDTSFVAYAILIVALATQFPYVFLNKPGKIKGNVLYLVALVMYTANKLSDALYDLVNYGDLDIIITVVAAAVLITYYYIIKKANRAREDIYDAGEEGILKKAVRVIKENRM